MTKMRWSLVAVVLLVLPAMAAAVDEHTKLVIVCNPNNPTGTYNTAAEFEDFLASIPPHVIVMIDEAYYEYVDAADYPQTLPMLAAHPNLTRWMTEGVEHLPCWKATHVGVGFKVGEAA